MLTLSLLEIAPLNILNTFKSIYLLFLSPTLNVYNRRSKYLYLLLKTPLKTGINVLFIPLLRNKGSQPCNIVPVIINIFSNLLLVFKENLNTFIIFNKDYKLIK